MLVFLGPGGGKSPLLIPVILLKHLKAGFGKWSQHCWLLRLVAIIELAAAIILRRLIALLRPTI